MARAFQFDVGPVVEHINRILQMELAAVIYYTHYSFMIYGHARIPITSWLRDNATESLAGPEPNQNSSMVAISVVRFESTIVAKARSKPACSAAMPVRTPR